MGRGEARASQVTGPSSSYVPWSNTPPETPLSLPRRHVCKGVLLPSGKTGPSASGKTIGFGAACPMAHMFARLRIADPISGIVARLTTGSGGLTLGRAGFAPAGRQTKFHEVIASSFPFDPHCLVALYFLLCCRCCQASLRIFSFLYFWTQSPIAQSHLATSFDAQSSCLQCLSARASPETITAGAQCPTAEMRKTP